MHLRAAGARAVIPGGGVMGSLRLGLRAVGSLKIACRLTRGYLIEALGSALWRASGAAFVKRQASKLGVPLFARWAVSKNLDTR